MTRKYYRENPGFFSAIDGILLKNTVLEKGLVVAPVVVVSNSLKNGVALSIAFGIITFFTVFITSYLSKKVPHTIRVILAVLLAGLLYIPAAMLVDALLPGTSYQIGIFLPLMITNSLIVWRSDSRFHKEKKARMTGDLICHILGFFVVITLVGAVRELLGNGSLWDNTVIANADLALGVLLPFAGFILLGFLAALLHRYRNYLEQVDKALREEEAGTEEFGYLSMPSGEASNHSGEVAAHE